MRSKSLGAGALALVLIAGTTVYALSIDGGATAVNIAGTETPAVQAETANCCVTGDCCCPGQGSCCDLGLRAKAGNAPKPANKSAGCCATGACCCPGQGLCCADQSVKSAAKSCCSEK